VSRGPLATHEISDPADEVLKARIIIFMTGSVLKKRALLVKNEHNMQDISDILTHHFPVRTCAMFVTAITHSMPSLSFHRSTAFTKASFPETAI
jgi:hypothetical protein